MDICSPISEGAKANEFGPYQGLIQKFDRVLESPHACSAFTGGFMRGRTKRLAIAVVLTIVDVAAFNYYCHAIWQVFARDLFAKASLLGLLCLWIVSAVMIWLHVAHDLRQALQEGNERPTFESVTAPSDLRRDSHV
jgi:hypothetical protein